MVEARHVHVLAADAAIVPCRRADELGEDAASVKPDLLAQIAADHVRAVPDPVRILVGRRVQQDPRRIHSARAQDHYLSQHLLFGARHAIEVLHSLREPVAVDQYSRCHGVRPDLQMPGLERDGQQVIRGVEERCRVASGPARAAVVASREAASRPGHVGAPAGDDRDADFTGRLLQQSLAAARWRRRLQELAARQ
jgi:hypothetical protein